MNLRYVQDTFGHVHIYQPEHEGLLGTSLQFCDPPFSVTNATITKEEVAVDQTVSTPTSISVKKGSPGAADKIKAALGQPPKFATLTGLAQKDSLSAGTEAN